MEYNLVVCGGTFDHLHKGHKEFLRFACVQGKEFLIGLTSDVYIRNKHEQGSIQSFNSRKKALLDFLRLESFLDKLKIIPIDDLYGPTLSSKISIDAIVVSEMSVKGAEFINKKREGTGLSKIKILVHEMVLGEDGKPISSSRIREGKIDRNGLPLKTLFLPADLRPKLQKPFGILLKNQEKLKLSALENIITVGDITTKFFNDNNLLSRISVVDFRVQREERFKTYKELGFSGKEKIVKVNNPAGCITPSLFKIIDLLFSQPINKRVIIKIDGEEDLAVLPLIIAAPLGTVIFYGQKDQGLVLVEAKENSKKKAYNLLNQFI